MKMKRYSQEDFILFEVDEFGCKICPSGDYTLIKDFGEWCDFAAHCIFGTQCSFGTHCRFSGQCSFGDGCRFNGSCRFGNNCDFGQGCHFGVLCFFGLQCRFSEQCSFGSECRFGEDCSFCKGCSFEHGAVKNGRYIAVDRIGSNNRKAYFYIDENGKMFVRLGSWFSDMATFKERVRKAHSGTSYGEVYLAACDLAKLLLEGGQDRSERKEHEILL